MQIRGFNSKLIESIHSYLLVHLDKSLFFYIFTFSDVIIYKNEMFLGPG